MTIFAEVVDERLDISYAELPGQVYRINMADLICDLASEPYRRGDSERFFIGTSGRNVPLTEWKGRPC